MRKFCFRQGEFCLPAGRQADVAGSYGEKIQRRNKIKFAMYSRLMDSRTSSKANIADSYGEIEDVMPSDTGLAQRKTNAPQIESFA